MRHDSQAMEQYREWLMKLDAVLSVALGGGAIDPDWKRREQELLAFVHEAQQGKKGT